MGVPFPSSTGYGIWNFSSHNGQNPPQQVPQIQTLSRGFPRSSLPRHNPWTFPPRAKLRRQYRILGPSTRLNPSPPLLFFPAGFHLYRDLHCNRTNHPRQTSAHQNHRCVLPYRLVCHHGDLYDHILYSDILPNCRLFYDRSRVTFSPRCYRISCWFRCMWADNELHRKIQAPRPFYDSYFNYRNCSNFHPNLHDICLASVYISILMRIRVQRHVNNHTPRNNLIRESRTVSTQISVPLSFRRDTHLNTQATC